jgi:hypothetical protein
MKEKDVQLGNITELRCTLFVSSVQVSDNCVLEIFHHLLTVYIKRKTESVCVSKWKYSDMTSLQHFQNGRHDRVIFTDAS